MTDNVNHPSHYTTGKIEVIDFIEAKKLNYHLGNVVKYVSRAGKKDPEKYLEDLQKAEWYLNREITKNEEERDPCEKPVITIFTDPDLDSTLSYQDKVWRLSVHNNRDSLHQVLKNEFDFIEGDEFDVELKDGTKVVLQYGTDEKDNYYLVFKDPMWREQMNEDWKKPNYWRDTDLREKCNGEYFDLLPDWLKPYVLETTNVQVRDGERVETVDKLFPLSLSQVFPEEYLKWLCDGETTLIDSEPEDTMISLFEDPRNRVKFMWDDTRKMMRAYWWFLRSASFDYNYYFSAVNSGGSTISNGATSSYGVVLGFRVR